MTHVSNLAGAFDSVIEERRASRKQYGLIGLIVLALTLWSAWGTEFNIPKLIEGIPLIINLGERMLPPEFSVLPDLMWPMIETLEMALLGTTIPIFFALPLAFLAAVNTSPYPMVSVVVRLLIGTLRTVPELIWAMVLVTAVGLGPFPGVLALTPHSIGGLGKFYYEAIEAVDPSPLEAMAAAGASRLKVFRYGAWPQVLPLYLSYCLYYWDHNSRQAAGILVGCDTGYPKETGDAIYGTLEEKHGIRFDVTADSENVRGRPTPFLVYDCMYKTNVYPPAAVVKADDITAGVEEGANSGAWTVGIYTTGAHDRDRFLLAIRTLLPVTGRHKSKANQRVVPAVMNLTAGIICSPRLQAGYRITRDISRFAALQRRCSALYDKASVRPKMTWLSIVTALRAMANHGNTAVKP